MIEEKYPIDDCLSLIGQKCNKLLKLDLKISDAVSINGHFFNVFTEFKAIEKLKIELLTEEPLDDMNLFYGEVSIESLKHCEQLKHLDINYRELREDFFANIASFVPKLQSLRIRTDHKFSDSFINSFNSIKNIQKVELFIDTHDTDIGINDFWYFGKSLSEVMLSPNGMNVKHINDNCILFITH